MNHSLQKTIEFSLCLTVLLAFFAVTASGQISESVSLETFGKLSYTVTASASSCGASTTGVIPITSSYRKWTYTGFVYTDPSGANHSLSGSASFIESLGKTPPCPGTFAEPTNLVGSGYSILFTPSVNGGGSATSKPTQGFVNPKYLVMGVTYAPPGSGSSVTYTNTTTVGNTVTISHSFQQDYGVSVSVKQGAGLSAAAANSDASGGAGGGVTLTFTESTDYTQGSNSSTTNTISKASTVSFVTPGTPTLAPVNSDYDVIWLWLNPEVLFSLIPNGNSTPKLQMNGYAFDPADPASGEPPASGPYNSGPDVISVQVGCLNGHFSCPSTLTMTNGVVTSGALARSWAAGKYTWPAGEGPGLTSTDIANILTLDPLVPSNNYTLLSSFPTTTSDGRFIKEPFPPNDIQYAVGGGTESYTTVQTDTTSTSSGTTNTVKEAFGVSEQFGVNFFGIFQSTTTVTETGTFTWTYSRLDTVTTTTSLTNALSIKGPPDPPPTYSGPIEFVAYQDSLFGTFAFVPVNP